MSNRRQFLADVGRGMLVASLGSATVMDLGLSPALADEAGARLTFGELEPLVSLMQETPPDKLMPILVERLKGGTALNSLVAAGALANVRAFAGQDYTGYHTFMALTPSLQMASELPSELRPLPALKVLYRNSSRIQNQDAARKDALHPVAASASVSQSDSPERLRDVVRAVDWDGAEALLAADAANSPESAFDHLQYAIQDETNVHRVVLSWRAWAMLDVAGEEHASALLRQSIRFCLDSEQQRRDRNQAGSPIRALLPKLLEEHKLLGTSVGDRQADDAWIEALASTVYSANREEAAGAVAAALAGGFDPEAIGEAISLAANQLVLHDPGRRKENSNAEKPPGCVHGDSVGVHASDSANAWRNIARVCGPRNRMASLIVGAYHTAGQTDWNSVAPYPYAEKLEGLKATEGSALLRQAEEAIRANDQALACAVIHRYGELGLPDRAAFDLLLKYAVSEDGALHAEKYYRTICEEYATSRPALRWRRVVALARVTASEYGYPAPGYAQSRELLGLS